MTLFLEGLKNHRGEVASGAEVSATLYREADAVWAGTLEESGETPGDYETGMLPEDLTDLEIGELLAGEMDATWEDPVTGRTLTYHDEFTAKVRKR